MKHVVSYSDSPEGLAMALVDVASDTAKGSESLLSGIQKLPDELIVDILKSILGDNIPSRHLASVCKRWKILLSETSIFWRKMRASFVPDNKIDFYASRLRRRLELSQSALLDVTLASSGLRNNTSGILFEILGSVDVGRWRSLKLEGTARPLPSDAVSGYFKGTFTSLRYLYLEETCERDPYWPIYELIAHSPPTITTLHTISPVPMVLRTSAILRKVVEIVIPAEMYREIHEKTAVETVYLIDSQAINHALLPRLPKHVTIETASAYTLSELDLSAVQSLDLRFYWDGRDRTINLPSLVYLVLPTSIRYLRSFDAPILKSLVVRHDHPRGKEKMEESLDIITLFQNDPCPTLMAPTTLDMCLSITTAAAIAVLSHWTQLEHVQLDLTVRDRFTWEGDFIDALKNSMCPNLITLRLKTNWGDAESERWRQNAVQLFSLRRSGPLELISWTSATDHTVPAFILAPEDI